MPELSIVDINKLIRALKDKYKVDFSCFSPIPFRIKLERILKIKGIRNAEELTETLLSDIVFFEVFVFELFHSHYELFRDPELWIYLNKLIPQKYSNQLPQLKILIPAYSNSSELLSMLILLEENGWREHSEVYISLVSMSSPSFVFNANKDITIKPIDKDNLIKVFPEVKMEKYVNLKSNTLAINKHLFSNVFNIEQNLDFQLNDQIFNLILFRNRLLNFSLLHQNIIIKNILSGLDKNGIIVFGYRENISSYIHSSNEIEAINQNENIFKKIK